MRKGDSYLLMTVRDLRCFNFPATAPPVTLVVELLLAASGWGEPTELSMLLLLFRLTKGDDLLLPILLAILLELLKRVLRCEDVGGVEAEAAATGGLPEG